MTWTLLISLLIKSSLVAGAGLVGARFLTQRPVERTDILRATVCLLLALPVIMNVLPAMDLALLPAVPPPVPPPAPLVLASEANTATPGLSAWSGLGLVGGLWLLGFVAIAGRLLLGLHTLSRWTREASPVTCADWLAPLEPLPPADRPGLVSSDRIASPLSWGVAPGFILVDPASLAERRAAPAILAHELAHLRRHDWLFLVLSRLALAMFWFNPLVWRLHAVLVERSEEAADAAAIQSIDRAVYAKALVGLAAHPHPARSRPLRIAATAMAADARTLKTRIACIMTNTSARRRPLTVALAIAALAGVATPMAALGLTRQDWVAPPEPPAPPPVPALADLPVPPAPPAPPAPLADMIEMAALIPPPPAPPAPPEPPEPPPPPPPPPPPEPPEGVSHIYYRSATPAEKQAAAEARAQAAEARIQATEARRVAAEARVQADRARRVADNDRAQADIARLAADQARVEAEHARVEGERARQIGERAREEAAHHMVKARAQMAQGAVQMRKGAQQMRAEAARLRDPAYRARQIEENRARGNVVTDAELRDLAGRLPSQADDLDRQADKLAAKAREPA